MLDLLKRRWNVSSRREFFTRAGSGLAGLALSSLLAEDGFGATTNVIDPLAPKPAHHPAKAKHVIFLFMEGGPSHIDLFDPKPKLLEMAGKPLPASCPRPRTNRNTGSNSL